MPKSHPSAWPRIWSASTGRELWVIGETKVSWVTVTLNLFGHTLEQWRELFSLNPESGILRNAERVPKKRPTPSDVRWMARWFFDEQELRVWQWMEEHRYHVTRHLERLKDPAMFRQIAELIAYDEVKHGPEGRKRKA